MTWIRIVSIEDSNGKLRRLYGRVAGPDGNVDNIMMAHSLRPHSMEGHMALYKNVLHHSSNEIPKWFLEALGVLVSHLNRCEYCLEHHANGMARLLANDNRAAMIRSTLESSSSGSPSEVFTPREQAALVYARGLTETPAEVTEADVERLRDAGWSDGEILEINQVVAYFAYANRTVLGLGVNTDGDVLGLSPSGDDWRHE